MSDHDPRLGGAASERDDHARQTFTWLMAHALSGALQPIVGALDLLRDEAYGPLNDDQRGLVVVASAAVGQLRQLQDDIVLLTRAQAGELRLRLQDIPLTTLLREAIAQAQRPHAPEPARAITSRATRGLPLLRCDHAQLRRALAALIENALRFSPSDTPISVETQKRGDWALIRVRDGGVGVAPAEAQHIFEPLVAAARPLQYAGVGLELGLGLAVARACAEAHGGRLTLEAPMAGSAASGCVFTLALPLAPMEPSEPSATTA